VVREHQTANWFQSLLLELEQSRRYKC